MLERMRFVNEFVVKSTNGCTFIVRKSSHLVRHSNRPAKAIVNWINRRLVESLDD